MTLASGSPATAAYAAALTDFTRRFPAYAATTQIDALRAAEYARLDRSGHIYLDYTGGGLYAESQLRQHHALLSDHVFGNPHSQNPTSLAMTHLVEQARAYVLEFFRASPDEYTVIFTPNASGALKLVGEAYPFAAGGCYALLYDNHNSINGIREFARARGATVHYLPVELPDLRATDAQVLAVLDAGDRGHANLFAYPAQSNFSGVQHPLAWVEEARARGWDVLLDAAAFAPTNRLDLSRIHPDFVPLSFYKMFGYPTGVGALLARHAALARLRRPWFAGGTITITSVQGEGWHALIPGAAGFEDGTVNYLNLPAVEIGLRHVAAIGVETIHDRVMALTGWLLATLAELAHSNGAPLVRVYGPATTAARGGTIAFTLCDPTGAEFDFRRVEAAAAERKISLRTGCFCNPGDGEVAHHLSREEMACYFTGAAPASFYEFYDRLHIATGKTPSTLRVSLGLASNFADVHRFVEFLTAFRDRGADDLPWAPEPVLAAVRERDAA
jgi:selenocysteine lyase/cysteine desulfurase